MCESPGSDAVPLEATGEGGVGAVADTAGATDATDAAEVMSADNVGEGWWDESDIQGHLRT